MIPTVASSSRVILQILDTRVLQQFLSRLTEIRCNHLTNLFLLLQIGSEAIYLAVTLSHQIALPLYFVRIYTNLSRSIAIEFQQITLRPRRFFYWKIGPTSV